jgi:hypothetical protein
MAESNRQPSDLKPERIDTYREWQAAQNIPVIRGFFVEDINKVDLALWDLKRVPCSFVVLDGSGGVNDAYICEIPPGAKPARYLALRWGSFRFRFMRVQDSEGSTYTSVKQGGGQIEFEDEDPSVHRDFEAAMKKAGAACQMGADHAQRIVTSAARDGFSSTC